MYFLNINKPKGITSFDVIRFLRKKLFIRSIGHSGTLDPIAEGVLQVGVGKASKLLEYLKSDKTYIAEFVFGYKSSTYDREGEIKFVKTPDFKKEELVNILNSFVGKSKQIPPLYSAIKQNGKKLCDIIRKNPDKKIEISPREIEIYSIELLEFIENKSAKIKVKTKKGTYIRSLVNDIGNKLNCGAYMTQLKRIQAGDFLIENSDELNSIRYRKINPLDVLDFDRKELNDEEYKKIINGMPLFSKIQFKSREILLTKENKLVSIAILSDNLIKPKKVFKED